MVQERGVQAARQLAAKRGLPAAVKRAYRKAALRYHPDRTRGYTLEQRLKGEEVWKLLAQKMETFNRRIS